MKVDHIANIEKIMADADFAGRAVCSLCGNRMSRAEYWVTKEFAAQVKKVYVCMPCKDRLVEQRWEEVVRKEDGALNRLAWMALELRETLFLLERVYWNDDLPVCPWCGTTDIMPHETDCKWEKFLQAIQVLRDKELT